MEIAIQGFEGSFHQEAATCFFGKKIISTVVALLKR